MKRTLGAMGATLLVIALGLFIYAGSADDRRDSEAFRDTLAGTDVDVSAGGGPWRIAAAATGLAGAVMLIGGAATPDQ